MTIAPIVTNIYLRYNKNMLRASKVEFLKELKRKKYKNAFTAFLFSAGSTSLLIKNLNNISSESEEDEYYNELRKEKQRFRTMMSRLKKDGLLELSNESPLPTITGKGISLLKLLIGSEKEVLPQKQKYQKQEDKKVIFVAFDIPEKMKRQRAWLRGVLTYLGFFMLQKSIWYGSVKIPTDFINDLKDLSLVEFIEIFSVDKTGTIERLFE